MPRFSDPFRFEHVIHRREAGVCVDDLVCRLLHGASRTVVRRLIGRRCILLNGQPCTARDRLVEDDVLSARIDPRDLAGIHPVDLRRQILFQDADLLVLDKQRGQLIVPGRDPDEPNLRDALRGLCSGGPGSGPAAPDPAEKPPARGKSKRGAKGRSAESESPPELAEEEEGGEDPAGAAEADAAVLPPWVVHRLDRDTSGVCVWAMTRETHRALSLAFQRREVAKTYWAIVTGRVTADAGEIDLPLRPHPKDPLRMHVTKRGNEARTSYRVLERFRGYALLELIPHTGRTHQLRVHLQAIGHPLAVDPLYGSRSPLCLSDLKEDYRAKHGESERPLLARTPLHAREISFTHPKTGERVSFRSELPEDMEVVLKALRRHRRPDTGSGESPAGAGSVGHSDREPEATRGIWDPPAADAQDPKPGAGKDREVDDEPVGDPDPE